MAIQNLKEKIQGVYENTNNLYPLLKELGEGAGSVDGVTYDSTNAQMKIGHDQTKPLLVKDSGDVEVNRDLYVTDEIVLSAFEKIVDNNGDPLKPLALDYLDEAPTEANTDGIKIVVLDEDPETKYDGYLYIITE